MWCVLFYLVALMGSLSALDLSTYDKYNGKIIGGRSVPIEEYPYQVSLRHMNVHMCGASILSQRYAITAAHCTEGDSRSLSIQSGVTSLDDDDGQIIRVERVYKHPKFNLVLMDYDLAILELAEDIEFSHRALPITIVGSNDPLVGDVGVVTGWGVDREGGNRATKDLQAVEVPIIDHTVCKKKYHGLSPITPRMFCAEDHYGGKDACQGDSGGPFAVNGELVGVVSWGNGCGEVQFPGVYVNISTMRNFVQEIIKT